LHSGQIVAMKRRLACFIVRDHNEPRGNLQKLGRLAAGAVVCRRQMLSYNQKDLNMPETN